jgi:hypothetical protein
MPRRSKKRKKTFSAGKAVRREARERLGAPPPTRVEPNRRRKPPKHKKRPEEEAAL